MPGQAVLRTTVVALTAVLAVAACGPSGTKSAGATASPTGAAGDPTPAESAAPDTDEATPADGGATGGQNGGGSTGGGQNGGGSTGGGTGSSGGQSGSKPTTSVPKAAGPTIAYFRVAQKPSCTSGTSKNPIEGTPVVVEWKASNVDSVAISVDGPGVYEDNLPPAGSRELNFPCSGSEGDTQRHTYLLTVTNAQGTQTKTLVVTATVHEITQV
ncbi:hypothetical protein ABZ671_03410 [Micromonospora sp. NPDC006766]|uniref:hypothetical protein n=1 Tax=Micromonospora sp. NPDC006766 TaxID=3154778 RepID=UPI0033C55CA2